MPRPKKPKQVRFLADLPGEIYLEPEELEALRLVDYLSLSQSEAASQMGVDQSTLSRILSRARHKSAEAILQNKKIGLRLDFSRGDFMKIAIATENGGLDDRVSPVFGRAKTFTLVQVSEGKMSEVQVVPNPGYSEDRGAGLTAAQFLIDKKIDVLVAGNLGPNASRLLTSAGITHYLVNGLSVSDAVNKLVSGNLQSEKPSQRRGRGFGRGMGRRRRQGML